MSKKTDGRQSYKNLWESENLKRRLQLEILRRTPTYNRLFDIVFTEYLQFTYPNNANIPELKTDPDIRATFLRKSFEGKRLANSLKIEVLLDPDVSIKIPEFAYYKNTIKLVHSLADTNPQKNNLPEDRNLETRTVMDSLRDERYLSIEIDLFNTQEDIRAAIDFWVFDIFWKAVNPEGQRQTRCEALDDEDLKLYDLNTRRPVLQIMREQYPETKGKNPNIDPDAKRIYRRLLSRVNTVKKLIEQEDNQLKALTATSSFLIDLMTRAVGNQPRSASPKPTVAEVKEMLEERKSRLHRPKPQLRPMQETEDDDDEDFINE
jgi:hypothetical protein